MWDAAAAYEGMDLSTFIRSLLDREMREYEDLLELPDPMDALLSSIELDPATLS
jgi:hypothetical protein